MTALGSELVSAAQKSLAAAQAAYAQLVSPIQTVTGSPGSGSDQPQNAYGSGLPYSSQALAYNASMLWAMQSFLAAAQQAVNAAQYIQGYNANAAPYAQSAAEQLGHIGGDTGSLFWWATQPDWFQCNMYSPGFNQSDVVTCQPADSWIQYTRTLVGYAQNAVQMAQKALGAPQAAPVKVTIQNQPTQPVTIEPIGPCPPGMVFDAATFRRTGNGCVCPPGTTLNYGRCESIKPLGAAPTHKCTAASATDIAQQIPGAPWVFERSVPSGSSFNWPVTSTGSTRTDHFDVQTPQGPKTIPVIGVHIEGAPNRIVLTCPYTGEHFAFRQASAPGVGRAMQTGVGSTPQSGSGSLLLGLAIGAVVGGVLGFVIGDPETRRAVTDW